MINAARMMLVAVHEVQQRNPVPVERMFVTYLCDFGYRRIFEAFQKP